MQAILLSCAMRLATRSRPPLFAGTEGGAQNDYDAAATMVGESVKKHLDEARKLSGPALLDARYDKFRKMAQFFTE